MGSVKKLLLFLFFPPYWIYLDFKIALAILQILVKIFIETPLKLLGKSFGAADTAFSRTVSQAEEHYRKLGVALTLLFVLFFFMRGVPLSVAGLKGSVLTLFLTLLIPMVLLFTYNLFKAFGGSEGLSGPVMDEEGYLHPEGGSGLGEKAREGAKAGLSKGAEKAREMQKEGNLRTAPGNVSRQSIREDIMDIITDTAAEELPFGEDIVASIGSGSAGVAGAGIGTVLIAVIVFVLIVLVLFLIQLVAFLILFGTVLGGVLGTVLGPVGKALGVGGAYGNYFGNVIGSKYIAGLDFEEEANMMREFGATIGCFASGPACMQQWRLNNTVRPDSQDVGETYGLKIERFAIGSGKSLDRAYKGGSYQIPVSFVLSNTRHGLKGIDALNVAYRVSVTNGAHLDEKTYCSTGWTPVNAYDADGDGMDNDIFPGTSSATAFLQSKELTLDRCQMLQPGAQEYRTVKLEVAYDYFSQATLYFDAMSRQYLQSSPGLKKSWTSSKTADTPVKAAINVNEPVLYNEETLEPQPFGVRATLNTDDYDVKYRIRDILVRMPSLVEPAPSGQCQFRSVREDVYRIDRSVWSSIKQRQLNSMFTASQSPPIIGCVMQLEKPGRISRTGETLTANIKTNYTVVIDREINGFKVYNSRCSDFNCPVLQAIPLSDIINSGLDLDSIKYRRAKCDGIAGGNGCAAVKNITRQITGGMKNDEEIRNGEYAVDVSMYFRKDRGTVIIGLSENNLKRLAANPSKYTFVERNGNWEMVPVSELKNSK